MESDRVLLSIFEEWTLSKLRALVDARRKLDSAALSLTGSDDNYQRLLNLLISEYEALLGPTSDVHRPGAAPYPPCQSDHRAHLVSEAEGRASDDKSLDGSSAHELWAAMEQSRVRELTCIELGIPPDTARAQLPANFTQLRKEVVKSEFGKLSEAEQATWRGLAEARKIAIARGEADSIAVQDAQESIGREVYELLMDKFTGSTIGESLVFTWQACYSGAADKALRNFHGQISTLDPCLDWFKSPNYTLHAKPAWESFAYRSLNKLIVDELPELTEDDSPEELVDLRNELQFHCEELFRLQNKGIYFNREIFWDLVAERPREFVAPERLPAGITFGDPVEMNEPAFRALYKHVWLCQRHYNHVKPEQRFIYEPDAVNQFISLGAAQKLKDHWDAKKREAIATAAAGDGASVYASTAPNTVVNAAAAPDVPTPVAGSSAVDKPAAVPASIFTTGAVPAILAAPALAADIAASAIDAAGAPILSVGTSVVDTAAAMINAGIIDNDAVLDSPITDGPVIEAQTARAHDGVESTGPLATNIAAPSVRGAISADVSTVRGRVDISSAEVDALGANRVEADSVVVGVPAVARDQPSKRGYPEGFERSLKATKRCSHEDATSNRTDDF